MMDLGAVVSRKLQFIPQTHPAPQQQHHPAEMQTQLKQPMMAAPPPLAEKNRHIYRYTVSVRLFFRFLRSPQETWIFRPLPISGNLICQTCFRVTRTSFPPFDERS